MLDTVVSETWSRIRERLLEEIGEKFFEMWFAKCRVLHLKRGVLALGMPNLFIRDWVEEHYGAVADRVAEEEIGAPVKVAFKVDPDLFREMRRETERVAEAVDAAAESGPSRTLAQLVVTPGLDLAVKAVKHVASGARPAMNPLLIHGPEGTGKSHLAEALLRLYGKGTSFYSMTGEEFSRRYGWSLKTRRLEGLRTEISSAEVVIVDDVQDLAGKPATQREFASLVDAIAARGGQIVLTADRHPSEIPDLDPSVASILLSGMLVEIRPPNRAETLRILRRVLERSGRRVLDCVLETVVDRVPGSVSRLDRLVRKLFAFAALHGVPVDELFLELHLSEVAGPTDPKMRRMEVLLSVLEERFDVERAELLSKRKTKALSLPRGLLVYMLREQSHLTFKEIGRLLGDRSHTSVYLMYRKYEERIRATAELIGVVKEAGRRLVQAG